MESLLHYIQNLYKLSPEAQSGLQHSFEENVLPKNEFLLEEGKICRHLHFVEKGALRRYYHLDGKEITHWFAFENDFLTSLHSFITEEPAHEYIQSIEGSIVWSISKEKLNRLLNEHHEIEKVVRISYEKYYINLEDRFLNAQFKTAAERYEQLLHRNPYILERVPLGQIASYLGISQETLSRIRSRL